MKSAQKCLRIPFPIVQAIQELAEAAGRDFSASAVELLTEAVKMRRCPGIIFADGPSGRRARLAGTGLDVWEVLATHRSVEGHPERLRQAYPWLSEAQIRAAIGYYTLFPEEIDRRIARSEDWTPERLRAQYPSLAVNPK
jgi:uncharacterized protein (DUF433 family)